ncbi:restriction endonuclease subunit S [Acinetobacter sp. YH01003]|uniref:restriction endonuclease subunit S n=1 Tax=Acinetobacter sp. YH01003 TaxID=2601019 RepID=UPI0015D2D46E|nr:restriction endonuclease subunit S [Acinetobacter sp. YH01003]
MVNAVAKYQKYAEYKDSGVEWLGKIPSHWHLFSLKRAIDKCTNGFWGAEPDGINDLCVLRVADFDRDNFNINLDKLTYRSVLPKEAENRLLKKGDLLIEKSGGGEKTLVGCVVQFNEDFDAITSNFVAKMTPNKNMESRFLTYAFAHLYAGRVNYPAIKQTTGIQNLDSEAYLMENFCFPSLIEQTQIANFLDHETTKIDSVIEKQQQLIELLKEKRQAVISHAVTKGLDPNVPMKDSGVEWLGQVPEHWKVIQFRRITSLSQGLQIPQSERLHEPNDNSVEYITIKSLNAKDDAYKEYIYKASDRVTCDKHDVLLARTGATGEVVTNISGVFHNNFFKVSYSSDILRDFLVYLLKVKELKSHLLMLAGTTTIPDLNHGAFLSTHIALASLKEQQEIIDFIDNYLERSMILENKAKSAIKLMQERRTALISAAVTGKIDVRNWQAPNATEREMEVST